MATRSRSVPQVHPLIGLVQPVEEGEGGKEGGGEKPGILLEERLQE